MAKTYYTVCPACGANLDPCEHCDCLDNTIYLIDEEEKSPYDYVKEKQKKD